MQRELSEINIQLTLHECWVMKANTSLGVSVPVNFEHYAAANSNTAPRQCRRRGSSSVRWSLA